MRIQVFQIEHCVITLPVHDASNKCAAFHTMGTSNSKAQCYMTEELTAQWHYHDNPWSYILHKCVNIQTVVSTCQ